MRGILDDLLASCARGAFCHFYHATLRQKSKERRALRYVAAARSTKEARWLACSINLPSELKSQPPPRLGKDVDIRL